MKEFESPVIGIVTFSLDDALSGSKPREDELPINPINKELPLIELN